MESKIYSGNLVYETLDECVIPTVILNMIGNDKIITYQGGYEYNGIASTFKDEVITQQFNNTEYIFDLKLLKQYKYYKKYIYSIQNKKANNNATSIVDLFIGESDVVFTLWSCDISSGKTAYAYLKQKLGTLLFPYMQPPKEPNLVNITFTFLSPAGIRRTTRRITCPFWKDIKENYPQITPQLDFMIEQKDPDKYGKLVFWHGPPGTGKTFMIRSLLQKWKNIADIYYITDPENFFGEPAYFHSVILKDGHEDTVESVGYEEDDENEDKRTIKLFVIEDGIDFLLVESRGKQGGAMSRLLNVTDGLLGQGFRTIFLITSNEKCEEIDPAFLRSGRCLQNLNFPNFSLEEAELWFRVKGKDDLAQTVKRSRKSNYSLSDLYAILHNTDLRMQTSIGQNRIGIV